MALWMMACTTSEAEWKRIHDPAQSSETNSMLQELGEELRDDALQGGIDKEVSSEPIIGNVSPYVVGYLLSVSSLPSGSSHSILIQEQQSTASACFILENMLLGETKQDALIVAASALDPVGGNFPPTHEKTLATLNTIVSNVLAHPHEEKYRKLHLGNHKLQRYVCGSWGAMHFLDALGFRSVYLPTTFCEKLDSNKNTNSKGDTSTMDNTSTEQAPTEEFLVLGEPSQKGIPGTCRWYCTAT